MGEQYDRLYNEINIHENKNGADEAPFVLTASAAAAAGIILICVHDAKVYL